jgi:signal transduction histidine kinase/CheY-like chemotaxis protein
MQEDGTPFAWTGCYVTEAIQQGLVSSAEEDSYVRADGSEFPVEITSSPLLDDDRITGAVVVFRDVTQRREVDRMKNEFLSVVSHELRTPLTSIRGSLGLIASGALVELTPQAQRMVSIAVESSDRLTRLINDILDIERIQSGKLPMSLVPQEAAELLEATATEMSAFAATAGVRLVVEPGPGKVLADADRVVQTLTNLVGNAIKFSPEGGVVRLEAVASGDTVTFGVHDNGRGIPEEKLLSVFEPFEQVDSSDARQKGGTGLGLAISRGIVERHGGRIWAESTPGQGTSVRFYLPRVQEIDPADGAAAPDAPVVLVCDDDPATVTTFSAMLTEHGYRPIGATSGREALERARVSRPAAVLLDMVMPGTSGAQVLAELKASERTRQIPVVVVSGQTPTGDPAVIESAEEWLSKPVTEPRLITAVASAIEGRRREATVLIIEDDQDLAHVLKALLVSHGLNVVHVSTVAEGVRRARELHPQVVVLDLGLPDGDGSDVLAQLRDEAALEDTAVVVYSAADVLLDPVEGFGRSRAVFLTKARVTPAELEDRVLKLVDTVTGRSVDAMTGRSSMGGNLEGAAAIGL